MANPKKTQTPKTHDSKPVAAAEAAKITAPAGIKSGEEIVNETVSAHRETVEAVTTASKEAVETVVKASNDAARKSYDKAINSGREQVETVVKANIETMRNIEDLIAVNEAGLDAVIKSQMLFAKGMERIADEWLGFAKSATEQQTATVRAIFAAKSPTDVVTTQADYAKSAYTHNVEQGRKLHAMGAEVLESAAKPVVDHVWKTGETLSAAAHTA